MKRFSTPHVKETQIKTLAGIPFLAYDGDKPYSCGKTLSFLVGTSECEYHPAIKKKRQMRKLIADRIISDELKKGKGK